MAIKIYCIDAKGVQFIMNHFSGENVDVGRNADKKRTLTNKAIQFIGEWSKIFPDCTFKIVDV